MRSPYPIPRCAGDMVRDGVGEHYEDACLLWYRLALCPDLGPDGFRFVPLSFGRLLDGDDEVWGHEAVGDRPDWLEDVEDIDLSWSHLGLGHERHLAWALKRGLLPEQPFLLHIAEPVWYRSSYEYEEYDYDCKITFVRALPCPLSLREIENVLALNAQRRRRAAADVADARRVRWADASAWSIHVNWGSSRIYLNTSRADVGSRVVCEAALPNPNPGLAPGVEDVLRSEVAAHNPAAAAHLEHLLERALGAQRMAGAR